MRCQQAYLASNCTDIRTAPPPIGCDCCRTSYRCGCWVLLWQPIPSSSGECPASRMSDASQIRPQDSRPQLANYDKYRQMVTYSPYANYLFIIGAVMSQDHYEIRISPELVEETRLYQVKKAFESNNNIKPFRYLYEYNMKWIKQNSLMSHLDFNLQIFTKCSELVWGQNLLHISNKKKVENEKKRVFFYPYECRLNQYAKMHDIQEEQSIQIMTDVVEAIYSVYKDQYICTNLRAENFVKAPIRKHPARKDKPGHIVKEYKWKLQSVPFVQNEKVNQKNIDSPYTLKRQYLPPQYKDKQKYDPIQQIEQQIVWNIGCLWLEILYGFHVLNTQKQMEKVKEFCIGNGSIGVFNIEIFKLSKKLHNSYNLLNSMLEFDPKKRKPLQQVFSHHLFGNKIDSHIRKENMNTRPPGMDPSPIADSQLLKKSGLDYQSLSGFIGNLLTIIDKQKLMVLEQEQSAIKKKLKSYDESQLKSLQISNYEPKNIKKSQQIEELVAEEKILSVEQLQKFIRPYKFYYDKTLFLARCSVVLTAKLKEKLDYNLNSVIMGLQRNVNESYDLIFTFQHAILYMRLIYLRNLLANIELYQNVFNVPKCTQSIRNSNVDSKAVEWQIFSETATYNALKIFLARKFEECERQLQFLVVTQNNSEIKLSPECHERVVDFYKKINYKKCPVSEFQPHYQNILISVIHEIDQNCILKERYKMRRPDQLQKQRQSLKNIGLLEVCIFIESPSIFQLKYRQQLFQKFMRTKNEKEISFYPVGSNTIIDSRNISEFVTEYVPEKDTKQIFSFRNYENFLNLGQQKRLNDLVRQLVIKYRV